MPYNWQITVAQPTLLAGMSFVVRYRLLPSTTWTNFLPNPTTNTFTIPNLTDGTWEVEIKTRCANGKLSPPRYHQKTFGNACCPPVVTNAVSSVGGGENLKNLKFNNVSGSGVLRVWINNALNGAPDFEVATGGTHTVTVLGAFAFYWSFVSTGGYTIAKLRKSGGNGLDFTQGYTGSSSTTEYTICQNEQGVGGYNQMQCSGTTLTTGNQTTNFYLTSCDTGGNITIQNNTNYNTEITSVEPSFYIINVGDFPVVADGQCSGFHGAYTGIITVDVTMQTIQTHELSLIINGNTIQTINVSNTGNYSFAATTINTNDDVLITLNDL